MAERASRGGEPPLAPGPETARIAAFLEAAAAASDRPAASAAPAAGKVVVGPGDDAAAIEVSPGACVVVSTDASVEGVHFRREWMTWEVIGHRAAAAALSDLAAMGAGPVGLLVSAALPPELDAGTAAALGRGAGQALALAGGRLLGGDLVASPGPVMLDVTVIGEARRPVTRTGARPGDEVWVTGALGGAASAVADLVAGLEPLPAARAAFERPRPRIREGIRLAEAGVRAMIDLSDGLARDARHLSLASGVRIELEWERLPIHAGAVPHAGTEPGRRLVLSGGEDYELLFAAPPGVVGDLRADFERDFGVRLTGIGRVAEGSGVAILDESGALVRPGSGFDHFGAPDA